MKSLQEKIKEAADKHIGDGGDFISIRDGEIEIDMTSLFKAGARFVIDGALADEGKNLETAMNIVRQREERIEELKIALAEANKLTAEYKHEAYVRQKMIKYLESQNLKLVEENESLKNEIASYTRK